MRRMATLEMVFSRDEVEREIPFRVIVETRYGSIWDTYRRKRRWVQEFTPQEREKARKIFMRAHGWYLGKGIPDTVRMSVETYRFWNKLGDFCCSI